MTWTWPKSIYEILAGWIKKREARSGCSWLQLCQTLLETTGALEPREGRDPWAECNDFVTRVMTLGVLFLEALSSGVITQSEIDWVLSEQNCFSRPEQAAVQRLGRLLDQGGIQLGCRL